MKKQVILSQTFGKYVVYVESTLQGKKAVVVQHDLFQKLRKLHQDTKTSHMPNHKALMWF